MGVNNVNLYVNVNIFNISRNKKQLPCFNANFIIKKTVIYAFQTKRTTLFSSGHMLNSGHQSRVTKVEIMKSHKDP